MSVEEVVEGKENDWKSVRRQRIKREVDEEDEDRSKEKMSGWS